MGNLNNFTPPVSFKGKYLGILVLTILQLLNGVIHAAIGGAFFVLGIGVMSYNIYTFFYGVFNLIFLYGLVDWKKNWMDRNHTCLDFCHNNRCLCNSWHSIDSWSTTKCCSRRNCNQCSNFGLFASTKNPRTISSNKLTIRRFLFL